MGKFKGSPGENCSQGRDRTGSSLQAPWSNVVLLAGGSVPHSRLFTYPPTVLCVSPQESMDSLELSVLPILWGTNPLPSLSPLPHLLCPGEWEGTRLNLTTLQNHFLNVREVFTVSSLFYLHFLLFPPWTLDSFQFYFSS